MPLTGQNARNDGAAFGGVGVAGSAARQYMNQAGPASGGYQQANSQPPQNDHWRFQRHDDLWWYYTPQRTWSVFQGNRWVSYQRGALYARDNLANARLPGAAATQQSVTVGRPNYYGASNGPRVNP